MKMTLERFIKENELSFDKIEVTIIEDKAYFIIDDGTLIEGIYEELVQFLG